MKIHELPIGAQFEFQGKPYVKIGPQVADGADGRRLIPRHATLRPLGASAPVDSAENEGTVSYEALLESFERFYAQSLAWIAPGAEPDFERARDDFLKRLAALRTRP